MTRPIQPPVWTRERLQAERDMSEQNFIRKRLDEGPKEFQSIVRQVADKVSTALRDTDNLLGLSGQTFIDDPSSWAIFRYFCAPPISEEDLWTLVGRKFKSVPVDLADQTASVILDALDEHRFPWVAHRRPPTEAELRIAVVSTAVLRGQELLRTYRRSDSAKQEAAVGEALVESGFEFDASRSAITFVDDIGRGAFSRERKVASAKCDVPARLPCGRLFAIECKISNGPKNSWKRLNREVGGKAQAWRNHFGQAQIVVAAVLAGVFDLSGLLSAQEAGVVIFWEHDLDALRAFLDETTRE